MHLGMESPLAPRGRLQIMWRPFGLFMIAPLVIGLMVTSFAMFEARTANRLDRDGVVAVATITGRDTEVRRDSDGDRRTTYYVAFTYPVAGNVRSGRDNVSRGYYSQARVGETREMRYWRKDPSVFELEVGSTAKSHRVLQIFAVLLLAGGGSLVVVEWRTASRAIRVRDHGTARAAEVTQHIETKITLNNRKVYRLGWTDSAGVPGRSFAMRGAEIDAFPLGSPITVHVDPTGRLPSVWARDVGRPA